MDNHLPTVQDREQDVLGSQEKLTMKKYFIMLLMVSLASACGLFDIQLDGKGTPTQDLKATLDSLSTQQADLATQVQGQGTTVALATYVPYLSTQVMKLYITPPPPGEVFPTAVSLLPPLGLVYSASDGLWQITSDGSHHLLIDRSDVVLSPDGHSALFIRYDPNATPDLWVINLMSGEERQLTFTSDRIELFGRWWPGQPDKVILGSWSDTEEQGPNTGHLCLVSIESGEYLILDDENNSNAFPAPSPDGQRIAYDRGGSPWIYNLTRGPEAFDLDSYDSLGIVGSQKITLASPSWSPDGKQLAWVIGGGLAQDASYRIAIAVFNLESGTSRILHPYQPIGRGGWPPAPIWSPDGQWLAINAWSEENPNGLWIVKADGSEEHYLGDGISPVWSPDGDFLAFTLPTEQPSIWLVQIGEWKVELVQLPFGASTEAWLPPIE
jgi:Tol biopolymer transport system component